MYVPECSINVGWCVFWCSIKKISGWVIRIIISRVCSTVSARMSLEAFSHNPSSGSITALSDRTTVDTRD